MRIRWTTRITMAIGVITLIGGIAVGAGPTSAAQAGARAGVHSAGYATARH